MPRSEMPKTYDPKACEAARYEKWEKNGDFTARPDKTKKPFCIVMPPPNITGQLHLGHAIDNTMQDILTRYHRMLGEAVLWLPGTDHASIATEAKIVKAMAAEGVSKQSIGRDEFLKRAWSWREKYGKAIAHQLRKIGSSCDWTRERFTMDEGCNKAVNEFFVRLYKDGLIYRGEKIVNWCPSCRTTISDAEVEFEEHASHIWHIRYPGPDGTSIIVATTRPETMLGDTAVAVNPEDERYAHLVGKTVTLPLRNREIPIVADSYVEKDFGSGAVKITPAHDPNDFEVAMRHNLPLDRVMTDDGRMTDACGKYAGMTTMDARKQIVADLEALGLLVKIEDYTHNVGECYRCKTVIEPLASIQWWVKMKPLAQPALEAVYSGATKFVPERYARTYYNWMENIRDWSISRQLWWGHRIPAWYCDDCGEINVATSAPDKCGKCGSNRLHQDEDVLDTWFSSALWPFSTMGWPESTEDLNFWYPTSVLVTGYDIIFFWVARMMVAGIYNMKTPPFADVLIHGIVRDAQGRKMSKSLDNGVDPLEVIEQFGADALRFSLVIGVSPGNDMRYIPEKVESTRNFANKIWNAARFVGMNLEGVDGLPVKPDDADLSLADRWILTRFAQAGRDVSAHLDGYDLGLAAQLLYDFVWSEFCDWYVEMSKTALYDGTENQKAAARWTLTVVLSGILKLIHPFMPFITSEIWDGLEFGGELMHQPWPSEAALFAEDASSMESAMEVIRAVRNLRTEMNVPMGKRARLYILPSAGCEDAMRRAEPYLTKMAFASAVEFLSDKTGAPAQAATTVCPAAEVYLPMGDLIDLDKERARIAKEIASLESEIERANAKLTNPGFTGKAPAAVIEEESRKLATRKQVLEGLRERAKTL